MLRNLHYPAIFLNFLAMLFLLALVPLDTILGGANVLSVLANVVRIHRYDYFGPLTLFGFQVAGKWLRIWVVVDAVVVLCGGVLTGKSQFPKKVHFISVPSC